MPTNIDQGTLDYYAGIVGLDPGSVSLELVNEVLNGIFITNDEGFSVLMDQYNYDNATKQIMLDIVNNGWVEEIETTNGFQELDSSDQEFILLANTVSMDLNPERNPNPGTAVGAMVGIIAGGACCGPIGAVIGAIVGGIAGSGVSDD
ncbi:MAG: glycine zipper family protein [Patiriisocius sp.]|uniref:glycine zipper family protein n=1 Tax=Patiriisocius sp. TaxID=2822396 RepID=UPI003EF9A3A4